MRKLQIVPESRADKKLLFQIILHKTNFIWKSDFANKEGSNFADCIREIQEFYSLWIKV